MKLNVTNEVGRLRSVLVHLPGREIDMMLPSMMEELLFDDILFGQLAREEHRRFQQIIRFVAEQVYDIQDLLEEVLEDPEVKASIIDDLKKRYKVSRELVEALGALTPAPLAASLVGGTGPDNLRPDDISEFELLPIPNLFFSRDPQIVLGDGVVIAPMATSARDRESLLSHYVFSHHPAFRKPDLFWMNHYDTPGVKGKGIPKSPSARRRLTLEGGDILVPRRDLLLVGLTERTNRAAVEYLAQSLKASDAGVRHLLVVEIPRQRSYMHLDTVFTIISLNECLAYPPVIFPGGTEAAKIYEIDLTKRELTWSPRKSLLGALKKRGIDLEAISCGGKRLIDQQREQWTDGANAFALAPGTIILYERNIRTAEELSAHGFHIVYEDDLLLGRAELETWTDKKYAIQIQGHELSRARGGPRCMTMPLNRDDI